MILEVKDIVKKAHGLGPVSLSVQGGRKLGLAGASGSGKSTLLRIMAGLLQPDGGEVRYRGVRVEGPEERLLPGHPRIAYLSQGYELHHHYRMEELLEMSSAVDDAAAARIIDLCGIAPVLKKKTGTLSGGEQQRVALARQLLRAPDALLLDEPFSNLDAANRAAIRRLLEEVGSATGVTLVLVSHDASDLLPWADEVMILQSGTLVQQGTPEKVYYSPVSEYVSGLFGTYNLIPVEAARLLTPHAPLPTPDSLLHLRPHQLRPGRPGEGIGVTILRCTFAGPYYELELQWQETTLVMHAAQPIEEGSRLYVNAAAGHWMDSHGGAR